MNKRGWRLTAMLFVALVRPAAADTVDDVIAGNRHTMDGVKDFTAVMYVKVNSDQVRVPESRAKVLFKAPDKFRAQPMDGDFAVMPRTWHSAVGNVLARLAEHCTVTLLRRETLGDRDYYVLKAVPKDDNDPIARHLLWVDTERYYVGVLRSYPREGPPATVRLGYVKHDQAWLVETATLEITIKARDDDGKSKTETLSADVRFEDYHVNVGLTDDQFKD
jgi:outer membrane lipoprotein-sorting protein